MKKLYIFVVLSLLIFSIAKDANAINSWGGNSYPTFPYISGSLNLSTPLPVTTASGTLVNSYGLNSSGTMIFNHYNPGWNMIRNDSGDSLFSQVEHIGQTSVYAMDFAVDFDRSADSGTPYFEGEFFTFKIKVSMTSSGLLLNLSEVNSPNILLKSSFIPLPPDTGGLFPTRFPIFFRIQISLNNGQANLNGMRVYAVLSSSILENEVWNGISSTDNNSYYNGYKIIYITGTTGAGLYIGSLDSIAKIRNSDKDYFSAYFLSDGIRNFFGIPYENGINETIIDDEYYKTLFDSCTSYLDVGCYVKQFFFGFLKSISDWFSGLFSNVFSFLFPDISFVGNSDTCLSSSSGSTLSSSGLTVGFMQKVTNLFVVLLPTAPPDNSTVCTLEGSKIISYDNRTNFFDIMLVLSVFFPILLSHKAHKND